MRFFKGFKNAGFLKWLLPLLVVIAGLIIIIYFFQRPSDPGFIEIPVMDEVFNTDLKGKTLTLSTPAGGKQKSVKIRKVNSRYIALIEKDFIDKGTWQLEMEGYQPIIFSIDEDTPRKKTLQAQFKPTFGRLKVRAVKAHKPAEPIKGMFKVIVGDKEKTGNAKDGIIISGLPPGKHLVETFGIQLLPKEEYAAVTAGKTTDFTVRMEMEPGAGDDFEVDTSWLELDLTEEERDVALTLSTIKLVVSPPGSDNIGKVLRAMGLMYRDYKGPDSLISCDIFFFNCGASLFPDPGTLRTFVKGGGCVYTSDLTDGIVNLAFPGFIHFKGRIGVPCQMAAEVLDRELQDSIGKTVRIIFDLPIWAVIDSVSKDVKVILRSRETGKPIMVTFKYDDGTVFYTCFHNHAQTTQMEQQLLQTLVLKQISAVSGVPVKRMAPVIKKKQSAAKKK
ncbi:MAG: hypothetical protein JSV88_18775 [Candidatus Aminicenantes bacterium]|nr:MAG: hypothetical protein JSV88_18775 [Candidatus Aminicenantes bacterium]